MLQLQNWVVAKERLHDPQSLKCLLSDPLWKKFANPYSGVITLPLLNVKTPLGTSYFSSSVFLLFGFSIPLSWLLHFCWLTGAQSWLSEYHTEQVSWRYWEACSRAKLTVSPLWRMLRTLTCSLDFMNSWNFWGKKRLSPCRSPVSFSESSNLYARVRTMLILSLSTPKPWTSCSSQDPPISDIHL